MSRDRTGPLHVAPMASPLLTAALLILRAVDEGPGQGSLPDDAPICTAPDVQRPLITWRDLRRLRAAVAGELGHAH